MFLGFGKSLQNVVGDKGSPGIDPANGRLIEVVKSIRNKGAGDEDGGVMAQLFTDDLTKFTHL